MVGTPGCSSAARNVRSGSGSCSSGRSKKKYKSHTRDRNESLRGWRGWTICENLIPDCLAIPSAKSIGQPTVTTWKLDDVVTGPRLCGTARVVCRSHFDEIPGCGRTLGNVALHGHAQKQLVVTRVQPAARPNDPQIR